MGKVSRKIGEKDGIPNYLRWENSLNKIAEKLHNGGQGEERMENFFLKLPPSISDISKLLSFVQRAAHPS